MQSFASHSHTSSLRCIANEGKLLATGGADDRIIVYDMKLRKELCILDQHKGTINCLQFTKNNSHLISGGADGLLAIVRVGSWMLEKIWEKAHKGAAIIDIAIHPTGKLALTLGGDFTLKTWNLIKGRKAFAVNLNSKSSDAKSLSIVKFAPDGIHFVLAGGKYTEVWSIETGGIVTSIEHEQKVVCCVWFNDDMLVTGYENGKIATVNIKSNDINVIDGHDSRVKTINIHGSYCISSSSNGEVKVWDTDFEEFSKIETGCRITCCCVLPIDENKEHDSRNKAKQNDKKLTEEVANVGEKRAINTSGSNSTKLINKKKKRKSSNNWVVQDMKS